MFICFKRKKIKTHNEIETFRLEIIKGSLNINSSAIGTIIAVIKTLYKLGEYSFEAGSKFKYDNGVVINSAIIKLPIIKYKNEIQMSLINDTVDPITIRFSVEGFFKNDIKSFLSII